MEHNQFEENLLLYGADISRWPEILQEAARKSVERNSELRQMLVEARAFEREAQHRPMLAADASFAERIIDIARRSEPNLTMQARLRLMLNEVTELLPFAKPSYALAGIAALGFMLGVASQPVSTTSSDYASDSIYDELTEVI